MHTHQSMETRIAALEARHKPPEWATGHEAEIKEILGRPIPASLDDLSEEELHALLNWIRSKVAAEQAQGDASAG